MHEEFIEIKKGPEFLRTAEEVSKVIRALPISYEENEELIAKLVEHAEAGRQEAYRQGVLDALTTDLPEKIMKYLENEQNGHRQITTS